MTLNDPCPEFDTGIQCIGPAKIPSPLKRFQSTRRYTRFVSDQDRILFQISDSHLHECMAAGKEPMPFEEAGPREYIYFDPITYRTVNQ